MIKKRHMILTEDFLKENPICSYDAPSLNVRQDTLREYIPKLAAKAASKAIEEWGQPKSKITHVVICNTVPAEMPGVDVRLIKHLGLNTSVKRVMLYNQGSSPNLCMEGHINHVYRLLSVAYTNFSYGICNLIRVALPEEHLFG